MPAQIIRIPKNQMPRAALSSALEAKAARPVVLPRTGRAVPMYDATAERWVVPPSGMSPESGAAAELRYSPRAVQHKQTIASLSHTDPSEAADSNPAVSFWDAALEVVTVASGLLVFGMMAAFFWVIA